MATARSQFSIHFVLTSLELNIIIRKYVKKLREKLLSSPYSFIHLEISLKISIETV